MRTLRESEITDLLTRDVVAHLATIDTAGYPHITPLWFLWLDGRFYLTSYADRPHLERMRSNPRVGLVIDVEDALRADGERPNRQVRVIGTASLAPTRQAPGPNASEPSTSAAISRRESPNGISDALES
ncbi:pyridoxamine 5'-phosphate oxidase family protein [Nocardia gipuzkoensis]|uniref:pyridoxamine 5'-phosphate oxidase family protein n=1 Tax=Nocardia gipuzkoensis TaxID=2749991 RepID=UPI00237D502F|nr:pyridoxamine 5'-phosphate oxidase family protein [Nocardia gipuzkoensis]MDE1673218.1 pyridoxamine 5'-phosphate oxidase family protein [Nocardia gipuzkoensis]